FDSVTIITRSGQKDTPCPTLFPAKLHTNKDTTESPVGIDNRTRPVIIPCWLQKDFASNRQRRKEVLKRL
ncbi:MAG: hypothetical protein ABIL25_07480, partial [candidate division WOR-3 bacterium]